MSDLYERIDAFKAKVEKELKDLEFRLKQIFHMVGHIHITSHINAAIDNIQLAGAAVTAPVDVEPAKMDGAEFVQEAAKNVVAEKESANFGINVEQTLGYKSEDFKDDDRYLEVPARTNDEKQAPPAAPKS
jgi:hypothetical protein